MPGHPMYLQSNAVNHGFSGNMVDPALMDNTRPISRYEESVANEIHTIKKQEDKPEGNVHLPSSDYYDPY